MRCFCISDIHVDYEENAAWIASLSCFDYRDDILIVAGDLTDNVQLLEKSLRQLADRFNKVLFVPGNHDLWVVRSKQRTSFEKFDLIRRIASDIGIIMEPYHSGSLTVVPLLGWYDYSFGVPSVEHQERWMDYRACLWPEGYNESEITRYFTEKNIQHLDLKNETLISFSHFLPRIDLMPAYIPHNKRMLYPILGSSILDRQVQRLKPNIHIYGHSHVNRKVRLDDISYINNAFGYPQETRITTKKLMCIYTQ